MDQTYPDPRPIAVREGVCNLLLGICHQNLHAEIYFSFDSLRSLLGRLSCRSSVKVRSSSQGKLLAIAVLFNRLYYKFTIQIYRAIQQTTVRLANVKII